MNYLNSLTLAWQQAETSKEAGDNSMAVKPWCGKPDIPKSLRQEEEHRTKARLPESQTDTGGSHPLFIPEMGQLPYGTCSPFCASVNRHRDGASNMLDNGRTGRLSAHYTLVIAYYGIAYPGRYLPARRQSLHITQGVKLTPGAASNKARRGRGITPEQSRRKAIHPRGKGDSQNSAKDVSTEDSQC